MSKLPFTYAEPPRKTVHGFIVEYTFEFAQLLACAGFAIGLVLVLSWIAG